MSLKTVILSLCPRLRVPVPPSCVHRDRRPDLQQYAAPIHLVWFSVFWKVFILFLSVCPVAWKSPLVIPAIAHCKSAWELGGIAASAASPRAAMPSCPPIAGDHATGSPLTQCPPARLWLNARRPASDSMPAGPPLTQCPPDRRWLKPAGSPLTQARRIAADSSPPDRRWLMPAGSALTHARRPPLSLAPWIKSTCHGQECRVSVLFAHRNILKNLVLSTETRLGQAAPLVVAMEAILAACPLVVEVEAVAEGPCEGPWCHVMPRGGLSFQASPGGLLVPVGCPVLFVWPWRAFPVLSCTVLCVQPRRAPDTP